MSVPLTNVGVRHQLRMRASNWFGVSRLVCMFFGLGLFHVSMAFSDEESDERSWNRGPRNNRRELQSDRRHSRSSPVSLDAIEPWTSSDSDTDHSESFRSKPPVRRIQFPLSDETLNDDAVRRRARGTTRDNVEPWPDERWNDPLLDEGDLRPEEFENDETKPFIVWSQTRLWASHLSGGSDGLGINTVSAGGTIEFSEFPAIWLKPRAAAHFWDRPTGLDLPSQTYDGGLEIDFGLPLNDRWTIAGALIPSLFTDGKNTSDGAFRVPARVLAFYKATNALTFAGGVGYYARENVGIVPLVGLIYAPDDCYKLELMIPRPKISWRYSGDRDNGRWLYLAGDFGGGSWAFQRNNGVNDVVSYSDLRGLLGIELVQKEGLNWYLEGGFVWSRKLEFRSGLGDRDLGPSAVISGGFSF